MQRFTPPAPQRTGRDELPAAQHQHTSSASCPARRRASRWSPMLLQRNAAVARKSILDADVNGSLASSSRRLRLASTETHISPDAADGIPLARCKAGIKVIVHQPWRAAERRDATLWLPGVPVALERHPSFFPQRETNWGDRLPVHDMPSGNLRDVASTVTQSPPMTVLLRCIRPYGG